MKKLVALMLSLIMALSLAACSASDSKEADGDTTAQTDMEYVKEKGTLVVGITDFDPMDYKDENGDWIGFDADMAKAFAESLGVEVKFVEIDWDNKIMELDGKTIDCVWNGMTLTDEVKSGMDCSNPYCEKAQVVVIPADKADKYNTKESLSDSTFAVEAGSAGEEEAEALDLETTPVKTQSDAAIIDLLMAGAMIGEGTGYENLTYTVKLNSEEYGVGFRKDSNLVEALNDFFAESLKNGTMMECAEKYGVQETIISNK